ncbi:MAG TPA: CinA family protein [Marmoricola sp.]|nr:CinA family protein [Marmoricola sp.]
MTVRDTVTTIAARAQERGLRVAVAESLTGGRVASALGEGPDAAEWFCGGVVAYAPHVKFEVLGVTPGPVVTERCAREMASGVAGALRADVTVGLTGVGGPDWAEGEPPGTVYLATWVLGRVACEHFVFDGDPEEVVRCATRASLDQLLRGVSSDRARARDRS